MKSNSALLKFQFGEGLRQTNNSAIQKAAGSLATGRSQNATDSNVPLQTAPAGGSHSQPTGCFSVEWWNSGIVPVKLSNGQEPLGRRLCE